MAVSNTKRPRERLRRVQLRARSDSRTEAARFLIALCEAGRAQLLIPAFAIAEPYQTLHRRHAQRRRIRQELDTELVQLARSASYDPSLHSSHGLIDFLIDSADEEAKRLEATRARLLRSATVLPTDSRVLIAATPYQTDYGLSPEDAIVYATVLLHLEDRLSEQSCFLNRNSRDFDDPDLVAELTRHGCKMLPRFDDGYRFVLAMLPGSEPE